MTQFKPLSVVPVRFRTSQRITITIPYGVFNKIQTLSAEQGRSFSNCAAYYLERGLDIAPKL